MKPYFTIFYSIPELPGKRFKKMFFVNTNQLAWNHFNSLPETQQANEIRIIPSFQRM